MCLQNFVNYLIHKTKSSLLQCGEVCSFFANLMLFLIYCAQFPSLCRVGLWNCLLLSLDECRKCTFIRRHFKHLSTRFRVQPLTTSSCGRPPHQPIVTSVRAFFGELPGKECAAPNVESSATRNAKICSMRIAFRVSATFFSVLLSIHEFKRDLLKKPEA